MKYRQASVFFQTGVKSEILQFQLFKLSTKLNNFPEMTYLIPPLSTSPALDYHFIKTADFLIYYCPNFTSLIYFKVTQRSLRQFDILCTYITYHCSISRWLFQCLSVPNSVVRLSNHINKKRGGGDSVLP